MLWKDRRVSIAAILTLAVCFAVNVAVFTVINSVLLQPLSVPPGDRIVMMANQYPNSGSGNVELTRSIYSYGPDYFDRRRSMTVFDEQAMFAMTSVTVEIDGVPQRIQG